MSSKGRRVGGVLEAAAILVSVVACRPYHMYGGTSRPVSELSHVVRSAGVVVLSIDSHDTGVWREYYIEPGPHTFEVQYEVIRLIRPNYGRPVTLPTICVLEATTQPGRGYVIEAEETGDDAWRAWLRDAEDDTRLGSCAELASRARPVWSGY